MRSRPTTGVSVGRAARALVVLAATGVAAPLAPVGPARADGPPDVPIDRAERPELGGALPAPAPGPSARSAHDVPATLSLPTDRDRDGVLDAEDACPRSGRGVRVGPDGCLALDPAATLVAFAPGSAWLSPRAARTLGEALVALERFPAKRLEVVGRTRANGADDRGLSLALRRAEAVVAWFAERGVPASRIDVVAVARAAGARRPGAGAGAAGSDLESRAVALRLLH